MLVLLGILSYLSYANLVFEPVTIVPLATPIAMNTFCHHFRLLTILCWGPLQIQADKKNACGKKMGKRQEIGANS